MLLLLAEFQSTLPRRERLLAGYLLQISTKISIHAPAKGATLTFQAALEAYIISIHAPAKGATSGRFVMLVLVSFQSTLPRRERQRFIIQSISKHNFNPRSREGSDACFVLGRKKEYYFNPRSREGSDVFILDKSKPENYFNPRSREGSDDYIR